MSNQNFMTVGDLIIELAMLDPSMKIVVPDAPYGQPTPLERVGVVILEEDDLDTGVPSGEYIGLNIGFDFDDDTAFDKEEEETGPTVLHEPKKDHVYEEPKNKIEPENVEDFMNKMFNLIEKEEL